LPYSQSRLQALAQVLPCVETICIVDLNKNLSYWQGRERKESKERSLPRDFRDVLGPSETIFEDVDKEMEEENVVLEEGEKEKEEGLRLSITNDRREEEEEEEEERGGGGSFIQS